LKTSTNTLIDKHEPPLNITKRGEQTSYYFGYWRKYSQFITMTPQTKHEAFNDWYQQNLPLFEFLGNLLKINYTKLYEAYEKIDSKYRLFGPWSMAVLNINSISNFHVDSADWFNGFCLVISFGDFNGAELHFPVINVTLNIEETDVALFQSHKLEHGNNPFCGIRHSLVLVSHNNLFNISE